MKQSKHEQEYIHIKKETLIKFLAKIHIYLGILFLVFISFDSGKDYGYDKGFQEGYNQSIPNYTNITQQVQPNDCTGIFTNVNKTETIKLLTEQTNNKSIYPLIIRLEGSCPIKMSMTINSDKEFPNESLCYMNQCLIKYTGDFK